jgi:hypothetical protein
MAGNYLELLRSDHDVLVAVASDKANVVNAELYRVALPRLFENLHDG